MEMTKKEISLVLGTVCAVVVFAICVQIKTISSATTGNAQSITEDTYLIEEALEAKENYEKINEKVLQEEKNLEDIRKVVSKNNDDAKRVELELKEINKKLGLTDLIGQGVIVTLDDGKAQAVDPLGGIIEDLSACLVHYSDVMKVINELWNAGAEAIAVNNQRIVATTAISCIGNVISINGEKVGTPFIINAIGFPEALYSGLVRPGGYIEALAKYGIPVEIKKSNNIFVPKYTGKYSSEYMKTVPAEE